MDPTRIVSIAAAVALVLSVVPAAPATHHVGPPDETGMGGGDVSNEPNTKADDNGLEACDPSCTAPNGTLVLDGDWAAGLLYYVDVNSVVRATTADAGGLDTDLDGEHEDFILPGSGWVSAWWGWWTDKGRGEALHETGQTVPGVVSKSPDATINDGHDDHETHHDTIYSGDWDEFVWRGRNPWAGQDGWDSELGGKPIHDGATYEENDTLLPGHADRDRMFAFVNPGTHHNCCTGDKAQIGGGVLARDADGAQVPDLRIEDRTDQVAADPGPYPHNNQAYGWVSEFGWEHFQYDSSMLVATDITYAVNPDDGDKGKKLVDTATAVDSDAYSAIHPAVEDVYRTTVWDPQESGAESDGQEGNAFAAINEEGPKQEAKYQWSRLEQTQAEVDEEVEDTRKPLNPAQGAADDLTDKARPHEPDTGDESGYAAAPNDDATYGNLEGESGYYNVDSDADYSSYGEDFHPWLDGQVWMASAQFLVEIRSYGGFNAFPTPVDDAGDRTAPPGAIWSSANLGAWHDVSGDTWVGNLGETGRTTDPNYPYADGRVDDPNDYTDTAKNTEADPVKQDGAEFQGAGQASTVTATLCPQGPDEYDPSAGCPQDAAWGTTDPPVGVYVLDDHDGGNYNPYDDVVEDTAGPLGPFGDCSVNVGTLDCDEDEDRFSQHVQRGPIEVTFEADTTGTDGVYFMQQNVVLPSGTLTYPVALDYTGTIGTADTLEDNAGNDLGGSTVTDVDYLLPSDG